LGGQWWDVIQRRKVAVQENPTMDRVIQTKLLSFYNVHDDLCLQLREKYKSTFLCNIHIIHFYDDVQFHDDAYAHVQYFLLNAHFAS